MTNLSSFQRSSAAVAVLGVSIAIAAGGCARGGGAAAAPPTANAVLGDVVLEVGGVGQIVATGAVPSVAVSAPQSAATGSGSTAAPADAVFATASGRIARYLVAPGERVSSGQVLAVVDDLNAASAAVVQAQLELETARLELRLKQTSDPARGLPASAAELNAARVAGSAAKRRMRVIARPGTTDVTAAQLELRKAEADLAVLLRAPAPVARAAAERAVAVAYGKLAQATGPSSAADVLAAKQELARAQADLEALHAAPGTAAVEAATLAVTLAQQKLSQLPAGSPQTDVTQARLELATAQSALETLQRKPAAAAVAAVRAAVDLAAAKLSGVTGPASALTVASARAELDRVRSELQAVRLRANPVSLRAARLAVRLARQKLLQARRPAAVVWDGARVELSRALAELDTLRRRGGPAGPTDLALARLRIRSAEARVADTLAQAGQLTVVAPRAGTVTALLSAPGAPVDRSTPIAVVADLAHLAVDVELSEFDVARVRVGQAAVVKVDALGGRPYSGTVVFEAQTGTQNGGVVTYPVRINLPSIEGVKPGMNVSVRIVIAKRTGVVHVPLEAVARDGEDATVTVVDSNGAETTRPVRLGLADNKIVEIRKGLAAGERVLVETGGGG